MVQCLCAREEDERWIFFQGCRLFMVGELLARLLGFFPWSLTFCFSFHFIVSPVSCNLFLNLDYCSAFVFEGCAYSRFSEWCGLNRLSHKQKLPRIF